MLASQAHAQVSATAASTLALNLGQQSLTPMNVAYDPTLQLYYAGLGGNTTSPILVYNSSGSLLQSFSPSGVDIRALNYNANTNALEVVTYSAINGNGGSPAGLVALGRDAQGMLTGTNTNILSSLPGLSDQQTMPAFNATLNRFYSRGTSNTVNVVSRTNGSLLSTITLATPGNTTLNGETIGYDSTNNYLITSGSIGGVSSALVYDTTGAFVGSSTLPGAPSPSTYGSGYTNGQLFLYNTSTKSFQGYRFLPAATGAAAPEPGSIALLLTAGVPALGIVRRRKAARKQTTVSA